MIEFFVCLILFNIGFVLSLILFSSFFFLSQCLYLFLHYQLIELKSIGTRENVEVANINSFSCLCLCLVKGIVGNNAD